VSRATIAASRSACVALCDSSTCCHPSHARTQLLQSGWGAHWGWFGRHSRQLAPQLRTRRVCRDQASPTADVAGVSPAPGRCGGGVRGGLAAWAGENTVIMWRRLILNKSSIGSSPVDLPVAIPTTGHPNSSIHRRISCACDVNSLSTANNSAPLVDVSSASSCSNSKPPACDSHCDAERASRILSAAGRMTPHLCRLRMVFALGGGEPWRGSLPASAQ
jgi:hypothetical protein